MATSRVPKYRKHPNGQAFIEVNTKRYYLGTYDSPESHQKYREFVNGLLSGKAEIAPPSLGGLASLDELILAYLTFARDYYGKSAEFEHLKTVLKDVSDNYGAIPAKDFGPRSLQLIRDSWIRRGWARTNINHQVSRVRRFFRWCGSQELVPGEIASRLTCLDALRAGKTTAKESPKVKPPAVADVIAVLPFLTPVVAAMVQTQYQCGMRPSDVCEMQGDQIDTRNEIWLYHVGKHKNSWRGQSLTKAIPVAISKLIAPYLERSNGSYLFTPSEAIAQAGRKMSKRGSKLIRDHYDADSYRKAVNYGFAKAKRRKLEIPHWHPNQLRHLIATEISQELGQQAAQRWLGHSDMNTTAIYAEGEVRELVSIAKALEKRVPK